MIDVFITPISLTALGFLTLAALPWLIRLVAALELPGGMRVEFRDLERIADSAAEAGLLKTPDVKQSQAFETVFSDDPNLALAGLRIELAKRLRQLATCAGINVRRSSVGHLLTALGNAGVLSTTQVSVISELVPLLNRAVHAEDLDPRASDWAIDIGPRILAALNKTIRDITPAG